jgi:benzylsuccinate CoA-transferase BbsE subunit
MLKPFNAVRILDLTHDLGRYVGRLFADLGAEVLKIETPGGSRERILAQRTDSPEFAAEFEFFNASKKSVVIDISCADGRRKFMALAATSQIVLLEKDGAFYDDVEELRAASPAAVVAAISPFGNQGPASNALGGDLILQAVGGLAWLTGRPGEPPLRLPGNQSTMITGVYAAVATSLALWDAENTGQGHLVEISAQECIAHSLQNSIQVWDFENRISTRGGEGTRDASEDVFACKDGAIFLSAPRNLGNSWNALIGWIEETGHPAHIILKEERWADRIWRMTGDAKHELRSVLEPFTMQFTKDELIEQALRRRIVLGPVNSMQDVLDDIQFAHRNYFVKLNIGNQIRPTVFPGAPYNLSEHVWEVNPAPVLGETTVSF